MRRSVTIECMHVVGNKWMCGGKITAAHSSRWIVHLGQLISGQEAWSRHGLLDLRVVGLCESWAGSNKHNTCKQLKAVCRPVRSQRMSLVVVRMYGVWRSLVFFGRLFAHSSGQFKSRNGTFTPRFSTATCCCEANRLEPTGKTRHALFDSARIFSPKCACASMSANCCSTKLPHDESGLQGSQRSVGEKSMRGGVLGQFFFGICWKPRLFLF